MINIIDRVWFLLKKVIILMVIFFAIWGVFQLVNREEERDLQSDNNYRFDDRWFMEK